MDEKNENTMKTHDRCGRERKRNAGVNETAEYTRVLATNTKRTGKRTQRVMHRRASAINSDLNWGELGRTGLWIRNGGTAPGRTTLHGCNYEYMYCTVVSKLDSKGEQRNLLKYRKKRHCTEGLGGHLKHGARGFAWTG